MTNPTSDTTVGTADARTGQVVWNRPAHKLRDKAEADYSRIRNSRALSAYAQRAHLRAALEGADRPTVSALLTYGTPG
jgi:hypothetical protein